MAGSHHLNKLHNDSNKHPENHDHFVLCIFPSPIYRHPIISFKNTVSNVHPPCVRDSLRILTGSFAAARLTLAGHIAIFRQQPENTFGAWRGEPCQAPPPRRAKNRLFLVPCSTYITTFLLTIKRVIGERTEHGTGFAGIQMKRGTEPTLYAPLTISCCWNPQNKIAM